MKINNEFCAAFGIKLTPRPLYAECASTPNQTDAGADGDALYIMSNNRLPELKIGRSKNPYARANDLQSSQPFTIRVLAIWPTAGHLEPAVHTLLGKWRLRDVAGREWFACSLEEACGAIALALNAFDCALEVLD